MSDTDLDFDPEELAMLRQLFRTEAHDALETVTARVLAGGSARPNAETITEMMRVTHTLKGAAGTVGLDVMGDLTPRPEKAFGSLGGSGSPGGPRARASIVEVADGMRGYLDYLFIDAGEAAAQAVRLREQIERIASVQARESAIELSPRESAVEMRDSLATISLATTAPDIRDPSPNESLSMPTITELAAPEGMAEPPGDPSAAGPYVPEPKAYLPLRPRAAPGVHWARRRR